MNHVLFLRAMSFLSVCVATTTFTMTPLPPKTNNIQIFGKNGYLAQHPSVIKIKPEERWDGVHRKDQAVFRLTTVPNFVTYYIPIELGADLPHRFVEKIKTLGVYEELDIKENYKLVSHGVDFFEHSDNEMTQHIIKGEIFHLVKNQQSKKQ
jgi:hypothetical protein